MLSEHLPKHGVLAELAKCHLSLLATASVSTALQFTASGHVTFKQVTTHCIVLINCTLIFIDFEHSVWSSYLFSVCCLLFDCLAIVCSCVISADDFFQFEFCVHHF